MRLKVVRWLLCRRGLFVGLFVDVLDILVGVCHCANVPDKTDGVQSNYPIGRHFLEFVIGSLRVNSNSQFPIGYIMETHVTVAMLILKIDQHVIHITPLMLLCECVFPLTRRYAWSEVKSLLYHQFIAFWK